MDASYVFDMDGTLIDSMGMYASVDRKFFKTLGLPYTEEASEALRYIPVSDAAEYIAQKYQCDLSEGEIEKVLFETVRDGYRNVGFKPGALEFIRTAFERGIRMCIATGTHTELALEVAQRLNIMRYMEFLTSCSEVGKTKDYPDVFLLAAERLGVHPSSCIVFEDGIPGARSAKRAGFRVIGVYDETASSADTEELKLIGEKYITSFAELDGLV